MSNVTKPIALDETLQRVAAALEDMSENMVDFSTASKVYSNVAEMLADETLKTGDNVATRAYYTVGDNGGNNYVISATHTGNFYLTLENGLYANLLTEKGVLRAESIGIKAYAASTENPDNTDMTRNVSLFNTAIYNGIYILFGKGYFYFNDAIQLAHKNTYTIRGLAREVTHLVFPNSDGFYFCDPIYYNHYVIIGMHIHAYGHTIRCAEDCLTVLDSHFEWLDLESETGDCFHAPNYNVAKYTSQGGSTVYDTCVQNCVFDFVNASAPSGAAFCNIMGMYTYYQHINLRSCKYGFRNCDGTVEQLNTLGASEDYFIYYDKANSHSLRWMFINVNAEGVSKAFIYTEPQVEVPSGEDPRKPETANVMSIERLIGIASGWSLASTTNHNIYPITVHEIHSICLTNATKLIIPTAYPSSYDINTVHAHIKCTRSVTLNTYTGGPAIKMILGTNTNQIFIRNGDAEDRVNIDADSIPYTTLTNRSAPTYNEIFCKRLYGGKAMDTYVVKTSVNTSSSISPNSDHLFCDAISVYVNTNDDKTVNRFAISDESSFPGRILTISNNNGSLHNLIFACHSNANLQSYTAYGLYSECNKDIILAPGECMQFVLTQDKNPTNNSKFLTWRPISLFDNSHYQDEIDMVSLVFKAIANVEIIPWTKYDAYIRLSNATADVSTFTWSTTGFRYVLKQCSQGDSFTILNGRGTAGPRLWGFVDSTGNVISVANADTEVVSLDLTAPANAAYLIVNSNRTAVVMKNLGS